MAKGVGGQDFRDNIRKNIGSVLRVNEITKGADGKRRVERNVQKKKEVENFIRDRLMEEVGHTTSSFKRRLEKNFRDNC